ncbi:sacsin N-terminal ATP-binding-like domain-containing protein [Phytoactinopolyspora limicola]|uniref:sacsin N-terminal ATP-binding-like domain-containing protein n=1 Tax=Phytoactinopolyspora limicola TaxID=2715536 RepID=UPI001A9C4465|nr:hypothetical protein [Phytoactinopolyspora limicola]
MDTYGTAELRDQVLHAWAAAPARFREDANAEEELTLGAYRDRVVVELAQNAADAAARAGVPGRVLFRLTGSTLTAANTGASLDAAGVAGLSTLRASPKRSADTVGRFGVGFAAVLAVSDEPAIVSALGGVRWSRQAARAVVADIPQLSEELARRGTSVPMLRLPFPAGPARTTDADLITDPAPGDIPAGYDTSVVLPLRDDEAVAGVTRLLRAVDDALLLALPALSAVTIEIDGEHHTLTAELPDIVDASLGLAERRIGARRWRLVRAEGVAEPTLMSDRPVEERERPGWSVAVAVPVTDVHQSTGPLGGFGVSDDTGSDTGSDTAGAAIPAPLPSSVPAVIHAPTPTDDTIDLPVLVIATLPLDSARRRTAPGPLTDHLVEHIGAAYAHLVASFRTPAALDLIPTPVGVGELDTAVRRAAVGALSRTPFVPDAGTAGRLRPDGVVLVDGLRRATDPSRLAPFVPGLPAPGWEHDGVLQRLGARRVTMSELVDRLAGTELPPSTWRDIYAALDGCDLEDLGALPVPLTDGRLVQGPRSVLLPGEVDADVLAPFRLRVAHPDAVHPLLGRLGAAVATARSVLRDPVVRATVDNPDDDAPEEPTAAVIRLVAASGLTADDEPWLRRIPLPDGTGELVPAEELWLPGVPLLDALDADPAECTVASDVVHDHGTTTLEAIGVRTGFAVLRLPDIPLDQDLWNDLDDEDRWVQETLATLPEETAPPVMAEFAAVRDLDLIQHSAWPRVLGWLAGDPAARAAVVDPVRLLLADGTSRVALSYTAWWLRRHVQLGGRRLAEFCAHGADSTVRALLTPLDAVAAEIDDTFMAALGVAGRLSEVAAQTLVARLGDPALRLPVADLAAIYAELATRHPSTLHPPAHIRVPDGTGSRLIDADLAVIADGPHWLQLDRPGLVPGPPELADVLDLDLASQAHPCAPSSPGQPAPVPDITRELLPAAPDSYIEHDELIVDGQPVDWWFDGRVHAATLDGLARGLAWAGGHWDRRWVLAQVLEDPTSLPVLLAEESFGRPA